MLLMYVDEAGDPGIVNSPTSHFVLSGLIVHEADWQDCLDQFVGFRRRMRSAHTLRLREEIHSARMFTRPGQLVRIPKSDRLAIVRAFTNELANMPRLRLINVVVDKRMKDREFDVMGVAWTALMRGFEQAIPGLGAPGGTPQGEQGMIFSDVTANRQVADLLRRLRPLRRPRESADAGPEHTDALLSRVIEDPSFRNSANSLFIQAADLVAFLLYQKCQPSRYIKKVGSQNHFDRLDPILWKEAATDDPQGVIRL